MKFYLIMRFNLIVIFLGISIIHVSANASAQKISLNEKNISLPDLFMALRAQSSYDFFYDEKALKDIKPVTITVKDATLNETLSKVFKELPLKYSIDNKIVVVTSLPAAKNETVSKLLRQEQIRGRVIDADTKQPLPGITVIIKGTSQGTSTNEDGTYTLSGVSVGDVLRFSSLGYAAQDITVGEQKMINVSLELTTGMLDEMVVVGYGQQKRRNVTGSVVSVGAAEIEKTALQDPVSILQGRAAGVQVTSNSGAPGGEMTIRVRGNSSLNSGNNPLFVVDGIPIESGSISSLNGSENFGLNPLADLNPTDIASIEILKDAASTAIYGSRAANGVVMITTKRGQEGKAEVNLNVTTGVSELTRKLSVLNATQYRSFILDSYKNLGTSEEPYFSIIDSLNAANNGDVDWQEELMRSAGQYKVDLSVRGGNQNTKYAWSSSYLDQDGIILNSNFKRITSRLNVDFTISDKIRVGQSISFTNGINNRINAGGIGNLSVIRELLVRPPIMSMYLPDGSLNGYSLGRRNPVGIALYATHLNKNNRIIGSQYVEYDLTKDLRFRSNLNFDYISMKEDEFMPSILDYREGYNTGAVRNTGNLTWGNESYFTYKKVLNEDHNFGALLGFSFQKWRRDRTGLDGMFFPSDDIRTLNAAGVISNQGVNIASEHAMLSYFGRVSYDYKSRYLAEFNLRADGSSRFGRDQRFGYFPSASVGWRFSETEALRGLGFLNDAKLRFSAGMTGNEAIGDYTAQGEFALGANYLDYSGAVPTVMPNAGLTWETTTQYNAGLDLAFLSNRLLLNVDLYLKETKDLLYDVPIPNTTGFSYITQNIGSIQNRGAEFFFTSRNLVGEFGWNSNLNISLNRNKVTSLPENLLTNGYIQNGSYHILKEGLPIGVFYGWQFDGVYARDEDNVNRVTHGALGPEFEGGDPIWRDLNNDNIINQDDRHIIGYAEPKFFGGLSNDFNYRNFSLNVFFQFSYGNDIYSEINHQRNSVVRYNNVSTDALSRWREQGDVTNFPKPVRDDPRQSDSRVQSRWVEDGSYIKLKNVNLRYSFAQELVQRIGLRKLDAFATVSNLIIWTRYTGFDPDVNSYSGLRVGVDEGSYPQSRTVIFGLNIGL